MTGGFQVSSDVHVSQWSCRRIDRQDVDHAFKHDDEVFNLIPLPPLDHVQFVACAFVDSAYASHKHLGEIVAGAHA
ncbi:hypothetical protein P3T21_007580 [Paraburkholderia sp. GAS334]